MSIINKRKIMKYFKITEDLDSNLPNVVFFDEVLDEVVLDTFIEKGTKGYILDTGKIGKNRLLTFKFFGEGNEHKSVNFINWKTANNYCKKIADINIINGKTN